MKQFDLLEPNSFEDACRILGDGGEDVRPLGGGTAMMILAKARIFSPSAVVALKLIPGHNRIEEDGSGGLRIGALTSQRDIERSETVARTHPVLAEAASRVGNIRVRTMSTLGGAICEADPQADLPGTLTALDAVLETLSPTGAKTRPIESFYRGIFETVLENGELVTAVQVPPMPKGARGVYLKHITGPETDRPCVAVCAVGRVNQEGKIDHLRLVLNGVSHGPLRLAAAESILMGQKPSASAFQEVAEAAKRDCSPGSDLRGSEWYKREMAQVFTVRALQQLFGEG